MSTLYICLHSSLKWIRFSDFSCSTFVLRSTHYNPFMEFLVSIWLVEVIWNAAGVEPISIEDHWLKLIFIRLLPKVKCKPANRTELTMVVTMRSVRLTVRSLRSAVNLITLMIGVCASFFKRAVTFRNILWRRNKTAQWVIEIGLRIQTEHEEI